MTRIAARANARERGYSVPLVGAMGQGQPTQLTDQASSRPLPSTSTLEELCGERYTYKVANADDYIYAMDGMKALGFVLVKNVFTEWELREIADKIASHGFAVGSLVAPVWPGTVGDSAMGDDEATGKFLKAVEVGCRIANVFNEHGIRKSGVIRIDSAEFGVE